MQLSKTIELFDKKRHDRTKFDCGNQELNNYLKKYLAQNVKKSLIKAYIAEEQETGRVLGYYTLSASSISHNDIEHPDIKKLPRYPIPAILIGRLAADISTQKNKMRIGSKLLINALKKCAAVSEELGVLFVIVDAKEGARGFYQHYGFKSLKKDSSQLFLKISDIKKL